MSEATKSYWAKGAVLLSLTIGVSPAVTFATPIDLTANFRLFGEVNRFSSLGFGDMFVSFGINPAGGAVSGIERGRIEYFVGSQPITTGVLAPLSLPNFGWGVVDFEFSVPFALDVDQGASMFIGLGTNFIGSAAGASGSKQVIFDFSDNIYYAGSPLGFTRDQGLSLLSVTLVNGTSLADAGLQFEFVPENTVLSAFASAADDQGQIAPVISTALPPNRAAVFPFGGTATSKLRGPFTDALVNLDVNPEPNPLVFDLAGASVGGGNNVRLTRSSQAVPEPGTLGLFGLGLAGLVCLGRKRGYY